jgi:hypothetical protein
VSVFKGAAAVPAGTFSGLMPHLNLMARRRCAVIVSQFCVLFGCLAFFSGCDRRLNSLCTENRHLQWQGIARRSWRHAGPLSGPLRCADVNAWVCASGSVSKDNLTLQFEDEDGKSGRQCNVTMPAAWAVQCTNKTVVLWPVFHGLFRSDSVGSDGDGCRLHYSTLDVQEARVGLSLLFIPVFLLVCICVERRIRKRNNYSCW